MREEILRLIEKNSKIDIHEIAVLLGVSEGEVANEIADMEKEKVICGYYTLIDWEKTSDERVTALIEVKATPQRGSGFDETAERIYKYDDWFMSTTRRRASGWNFPPSSASRWQHRRTARLRRSRTARIARKTPQVSSIPTSRKVRRRTSRTTNVCGSATRITTATV